MFHKQGGKKVGNFQCTLRTYMYTYMNVIRYPDCPVTQQLQRQTIKIIILK